MKEALIPNFRLYGTRETTGPNLFFNILRIGPAANTLTPTHYAPHRHAQLHEVLWLAAGQIDLTIDEATYSLEPNTLCVIGAGRVHGSVASPDVAGILLHFSADFLLSELSEAGSRLFAAYSAAPPRPVASAETAARIGGLFERIEEEFTIASREKNELIRHYLHIILLELQREAGAAQASQPDDASHVVASRFAGLVEQHYATKKQVSDYADLLHLTPNYLNVLVKHTTGRSAGQFIRDRVILEAKRLLLFSEASVSEVAYALNYDDVSYFWRLFKKVVHVSPTEFKKQGQQS